MAVIIATDNCVCGGGGPREGCAMNDVWHALNGTYCGPGEGE